MTLRELLAAGLIIAGIASTSFGASILSPAAGYVTGVALPVDGGATRTL